MTRSREERSWTSVLGDIALTMAALLGTLCIGLVIAAVFFDVRIILFSTGSMSPTIPAGSAAIVRQIPAVDVSVGDVITVDRPGELPITHRATSVTTVPGASDGHRRITMRGDANVVDDPFPYDVTSVRLVVFSVPGIAPAVAALGNPWVLGTATIGATVLVVWAFWPRRPKRQPPVAEDSGRPRGSAGAVAGTALVLALAASVAAPTPARAAGDELVIQGPVIRLVSIEQPQMRDLSPGASAAWQVGVSADAPTPGVVTVRLSSTGDAALALRYEVADCPVRWTDDGCPAPTTLLAEQPVPLDGAERGILSMPTDEQRWLRILVTRPGSEDADVAGAVDIVVRATGAGDDVSTDPGGTGGLPATGGGAPWLMGSLSVLLLAAGAGLALRARRVR